MDQRIEQIFRDVLEDDQLAVTESLSSADNEAWDSLAQVKLVIALEEEFGTKFTIDEVATMHTAGDIINALRAKGVAI